MSVTFGPMTGALQTFQKDIKDFLNGIKFGTKVVFILCLTTFALSFTPLFTLRQFCLQPASIWNHHQFYRLLTYPLLHIGLLHLIFNMGSFIQLGNSLEKVIGSIQFLFQILVFTILAGGIHTLICYFGSKVFTSDQFFSHFACSAGISGVIFGLIVIDTFLSSQKTHRLLFFNIPSSIYPWVLLVFIQLLVPNASILGHLSGMILGYIYCMGLMNWVFLPASWIQKIESMPYVVNLTTSHGLVVGPSSSLPLFFSQKWSVFGSQSSRTDTPPSPIPSFSSPYSPTFPGKGQPLGKMTPNEEDTKRENIQYLISKGHSYDQAEQALKKTNNNLQLALELLHDS